MYMRDEPEIWDLLQCSECGRYVDKETGEIVPKPTHGRVVSHTVCEDCAVDILALRREALERKRRVAREAASAPAPARVMGPGILAERAIRYCVIRAGIERSLGLEGLRY